MGPITEVACFEFLLLPVGYILKLFCRVVLPVGYSEVMFLCMYDFFLYRLS